MAEQTARVDVQEIQFEAVVIRCQCDDPSSHPDTPCPDGLEEGHGTVAYWHKNPLVRLARKLGIGKE